MKLFVGRSWLPRSRNLPAAAPEQNQNFLTGGHAFPYMSLSSPASDIRDLAATRIVRILAAVLLTAPSVIASFLPGEKILAAQRGLNDESEEHLTRSEDPAFSMG